MRFIHALRVLIVVYVKIITVGADLCVRPIHRSNCSSLQRLAEDFAYRGVGDDDAFPLLGGQLQLDGHAGQGDDF